MTHKPAPVETKVKAASTVAPIAALLMTALSEAPFLDAMPMWARALIIAAVTGASSLAAGYKAPHTPRAPQATAGSTLLAALALVADIVRDLRQPARADVDGRHERRHRDDDGAADQRTTLATAVILGLVVLGMLMLFA